MVPPRAPSFFAVARRRLSRSLISRHQKGTLLWQTRPWRDLDDGADGSGAGPGADLTQAFAQVRSQLGPFRPDELELLARGLGQGQRLERQLDDRRRQLQQLRPERDAQAGGLGGCVPQRDRPPPRAAADEPRRQRDLSQCPPAALRPGEQPVEQDAERAPQRQLVSDRLGKLERLRQLRRWPAPAYAPARASSRQAPGAPAVRPQTFGHGATRKPGKLAKLLDPQLLQLFPTARVDRKQRQRQRREELPRALVRDDERLPRARHVRRRQRREA